MEAVSMAHNTSEGSVPPVPREARSFDLDVSFIRWFSVGILVLIIVTAAAAFGMLGGFRIPLPRAASAAAPDTKESAAVPFATLQSAPQDDLRSYHRDKASALESYRWIDRAGGIVQIPIERAMELVAVQGSTQGSAQQTAPGIKPAAPAAPEPGGAQMR
jgi:hypothetical protein